MKKALAVLLSVLVIFSMLGVVASAEDINTEDHVTVEYYDDDGKQIKVFYVLPGTIIDSYVPENPVKQDTETERYIFKGWRCDFDGELYYKNTVQYVFEECEAGSVIKFHAEYSVENIEERQTFWNFIESIFERINLLFQYFAKIFEW